jgi:O-antigen/teichoic acid export membrane protein
MISDLGFQAFVVRHPDAGDRHFRDVIWTIRLIRSFALTIALFLIAAPLATLIQKPELTPLIQAFSLYFVLEGAVSLSQAMAVRDRKLLALGIVDLTVAVAQLICSILFAICLRNYWAILYAMLIGNAVRILLSYVMFQDSGVRLRLDRSYASELFKFARFITGSSIITLILTQTDKLVLARLISLDDFGLYMIAANLAGVPAAFAGSYASRLLYPRFADAWRERPETIKAYFYSNKRLLTLAYMLGVGGSVGAAPLVIELLYDDRYRSAGAYLSLLAIAPLLAFTNQAISSLMTAIGKLQIVLNGNAARLIWLAVIGPPAFLYYGAIGLVTAFATVEVAALLYHWNALYRTGLFSLREELYPLGVALLGCLLGRGFAWIVTPFL